MADIDDLLKRAEQPDDEPDEEGVVVYHLHVSQDDMGRVIGKQGRIAKAIRSVVKAAASREDKRVIVDIVQ